MRSILLLLPTLLLPLLAGCRAARDAATYAALPPPPSPEVVAAELAATELAVKPVDFEQASPSDRDVAIAAGEQPRPDDRLALNRIGDELTLLPVPEATPGGLTLDTLEQMALAANPSIGVAEAQWRALRGKYVQVGLPPNPTVGYAGTEIGNDGRAGQQGAYAGQEFVTAGKLAKNRAIVAAELARADQVLEATRQRVRTDVRAAFYRALIAQRRVELAEQLVGLAREATNTSQRLLEIEEISRAAVLQSEVQQQQTAMQLRVAENDRQRSWRELSAVAGGSNLPPQPLQGEPHTLPTPLDWQEQLGNIQQNSPEVADAVANVVRAQRMLARACVEPVPNVSTQVSVQYDDSTEDTIASVQVGVPLPLWDRNQGDICRARSKVTQATRNVERVELNLQQRLARVYQDYADALARVEIYSADILPRAEQSFELVRQGYREAGELSYLDFLVAQRTYSEANLAYLDALGEMWQCWAAIDGRMLNESLSSEIDLGL